MTRTSLDQPLSEQIVAALKEMPSLISLEEHYTMEPGSYTHEVQWLSARAYINVRTEKTLKGIQIGDFKIGVQYPLAGYYAVRQWLSNKLQIWPLMTLDMNPFTRPDHDSLRYKLGDWDESIQLPLSLYQSSQYQISTLDAKLNGTVPVHELVTIKCNRPLSKWLH